MTKREEMIEAAACAIWQNRFVTKEPFDRATEGQRMSAEIDAIAAVDAIFPALNKPNAVMVEAATADGGNLHCDENGAWVVDPDFVVGFKAMISKAFGK
jgi:hypothetical protein